jgi:hypothetical protein
MQMASTQKETGSFQSLTRRSAVARFLVTENGTPLMRMVSWDGRK